MDPYKGPAAPFAHSSGPRPTKLAMVGEAFGESEHLAGRPFVGSSGQELTRILTQAGIPRRECFLTNVLAFRPDGNDLDTLCLNRAAAGTDYAPKALRPGKYLDPIYLPELERLRCELLAVRPNLVVALGSTASWALLNQPAIGAIRGTVTMGAFLPGVKILPTYHPAAVLRSWSLRPVVVADLLKAAREMEFPELRRPERTVMVNPTLFDIQAWFQRPATMYAVDIETYEKQITMIGFARSPKDAIVVPFVDPRNEGHNFWENTVHESTAWRLVAKALASPIPKLFQNGLYDLQYIYRMGMPVRNCHHDSMLLSHALFPEMQKGLGFLGSVFTNESSWKLLNSEEGNKRDA